VIAIENVRLFDEVQARTSELSTSLENLRTTQDRLVQTQKLALLGQLTAGIAHEIKNPLNFVNNFSGISAELIDELQDTLNGISLDDKARIEINELTGTLKSNFDKVVHHGRRADAIVKNMLQHSREGTGEHRRRLNRGGYAAGRVHRDQSYPATRRGVRLRSAQCPLLAQSRHELLHRTCQLSGVKRTWLSHRKMSAYDPKRRLAGCLATCSSARCHPLTSPFRALVYPQSF
jgi:signal transduction histidine kinase